MIKLKINGLKAAASAANTSSTNDAGAAVSDTTPAPKPAIPKLKLNVSQPPTPIDQPTQPNFQQPAAPDTERKKRPYRRKQDGVATGKGKKRAANDDSISPAAKRLQGSGGPAAPSRKISLKLGGAPGPAAVANKPKIALSHSKRKSSVPKLVGITHRGKAPPRPQGVGYDSEDSDVEKDPAIQQALLLRMEEGEDANYLRQAIAEGRIGPSPNSGDAEVSLRFVEKNYRRAVIKIRGRMYAAALVDIPCIVESMKSFDKKGWWKVADIAQMLLVLGRCNSEEEAKTKPLPREVSKDYQYAHGLTPPMHWVRRRRFRKRVNYNEIANVEEEVERLLKADQQWQDECGGQVHPLIEQSRLEAEQSVEPQEYDDEEDAEGEAVETVETDGHEYDLDGEEDVEDFDLEAQMQAEFDQDEGGDASGLLVDSPAPLVDQAASLAAVEGALDDTPVGTPATAAAAGMETQDEEESDDDDDESDDDDDDDDDADGPGAFDEDAVARAAELAQQREEVQDLEREVARARQKVQSMTNQLLRARELQKLSALEEDLRLKKSAFGLDQEDED